MAIQNPGVGGTVEVSEVESLTKGNLIVGDGSGAPSQLTVGSNDQVLTADSAEATGVKWAAAAGGGGHVAGTTLANSAGTITTTSSSMVDATNVTKSITVSATNDVFAIATFDVYHNTDATYITASLLIDGTEVDRKQVQTEGTSANRQTMTLAGLKVDVASGSREAKVQWLTGTGTATMDQSNSNGSACITVWEMKGS